MCRDIFCIRSRLTIDHSKHGEYISKEQTILLIKAKKKKKKERKEKKNSVNYSVA